MRPQGYLGRAFNQRHGGRLGLPERLNDWGDTHALRALLLQGDDLPGNVLLGAAAREQFVNAPAPLPIPAARRSQAYVELAAAATRGELQGSSAAGEQPKFTAYVQPEAGLAVHTIVKFSASLPSLVSERWRDLLLAEHIALQVLGDAGIPASLTRVIDHGTQRFLEVQRFDRGGPWVAARCTLSRRWTRNSWAMVADGQTSRRHWHARGSSCLKRWRGPACSGLSAP